MGAATDSAARPTIVIDTREPPHTAWAFDGLETMRAALKTGDYSVLGYEERVVVERKELGDFAKCCTYDRARFFEQVARLAKFEARVLIIESDPASLVRFVQVETRMRGSCVSAKALEATALAVVADFGVPVWWASDRARGNAAARWFLQRFWDRAIAATAAEREAS